MREIVALLVAGLGVFFLGLELVSTGFQASGSRRLRSLIRQSTKNISSCAALGVLSGAVMQSASAVTVVLGSMTSSGMITVRQALPIVASANVGTTALVFIGALDIRIAVLYLVGLSGIAFSLTSEFRWRSLTSIALGLGLLLYGSDLMTLGASGIEKSAWFREFVRAGHGSGAEIFILGTLASFLAQSTTAVALITVALSGAQLLSLPDAMMMVYGANLGSTLIRILLSHGRTGTGRQISGFQDLFKTAGAALFVGLYYLEYFARVPLVGALVMQISSRLPLQVALINLLFNGTMVVVASLVARPVERFLVRTWPPSRIENLSVPKYINADALGDPETAIDLLEKEQSRVVAGLRDHLELLRPEAGLADKIEPIALHRGFLALFGEIEHFYNALVGKHLASKTSERLSNVHARLNLLMLVEDSLHQLAFSVQSVARGAKINTLTSNFVESLDLFLMLTSDAAVSLGREDITMLQDVCGDRSEMMGRIRNLYLAPEQELPPAEKALLLKLTTLFERIVWMLRRYAGLLEQNLEAGTT
jgi:phosphate:Na+ symporter